MSNKLLTILLIFGFMGRFFAPNQTTTAYGFQAGTGAKLLVNLVDEGKDGFYFDEYKNLHFKIGSDKYDILNIEFNSNTSKFDFKEISEIKYPIYSSTAPGILPSMIAKRDNQFYLLHPSDGTYKPILLDSGDIETLASVSLHSGGGYPTVMLNNRCGVKLITAGRFGGTYLIVTET